MQTDPDGSKNAVFGIVKNSTVNEPLEGSTVQLFRVLGTGPELAGTVSTNSQGQYLFANLVNGTYFIDASKSRFLSNQSATFDVAGREFVPSDIGLAADLDAKLGTISGFITNRSNNSAISNAVVTLYSISNGTENIVEITKSNAAGLYLFWDVPPGVYRVKATVQVDR